MFVPSDVLVNRKLYPLIQSKLSSVHEISLPVTPRARSKSAPYRKTIVLNVNNMTNVLKFNANSYYFTVGEVMFSILF